MRRVLFLTLGVNLTVAAVEGGYGLLSGSLGMQADGLHALLHAVGSVVALVGVSLAARPADPSHPYGYERYEPLAALGTVAFMLLAVREILVNAFARLAERASPTVTPYSFAAVGIAVVAGVGLGMWEQRRGRELSSPVLAADGKRAMSDALVSLSVVAGLLAAKLGRPLVDPVVALGIALVIGWTGWSIVRDASAIVTDAAVADLDRITGAARNVPGVRGVHRVRARGAAGSVRVDLHVTVDPTMSVAQAHELTHRVRDRIRQQVGGITEVLIHVGAEPEPEHSDEE